jgi:hypothetical protein
MFLRNKHLNDRCHTWGESSFLQRGMADEVQARILVYQF